MILDPAKLTIDFTEGEFFSYHMLKKKGTHNTCYHKSLSIIDVPHEPFEKKEKSLVWRYLGINKWDFVFVGFFMFLEKAVYCILMDMNILNDKYGRKEIEV